MKKALVVGSLNMDITAGVEKLPKLGETIFGKSFYKSCGGKGANQAVAISKIGLDTTMLGMVGNDSDGNELIENLKANNISSSVIISNESTGRAIITVDAEGNNNIIVIPGANFKITKEDIEEKKDLFKESNIVILQNEIPIDVTEYVLKKSKEYNNINIFNPAPAYRFKKEMYINVDYLILNETELEYIFDVDYTKVDEIVKVKKEYGIKNMIVTLGEKGSISIDINDEVVKHNAYKVKAVDTTAAGDSFIGTFAYMIVEGNTLYESIKYATAVSAIVVTRKGAQESIPTKNEIDLFLSKNS